jgi:two-component system sensor histidine kinase ChiS
MDGFQVCTFIRQHFNENVLPIILLSANAQSENMIKGNQAGANAYLSKPFDKDNFLRQIKNFLP